MKQKGIFFAHSFGGFSLWSDGPTVKGPGVRVR